MSTRIRLSGTSSMLFAAILFAGLFAAVPAAFGGFSAPTQFGVGTGPESIAAGDLDGDGDLDLVAPNSSLGNVSVLLGEGDGSFGPKTDFTVGTSPTSVAIASLNPDDDSHPDLAVANSGGGTVSILLGDGSGSFSAATGITVGTYPVFVAAGRLDADGDADLVVANQNSGDITVLISSGDGTFTTGTIATGAGARSVAIGDVDNDGANDLAVASAGTGKATILLGDGSGQFAPPVDFAAGGAPFSIAMADLDSDGASDLAVVNNLHGSGPVAVLPGDGSGGFGSATNYPTGSFPRSVAIGNLVGDPSPDLVVANSGSSFEPGTNVSVFAGDGDGGFSPKVDFPAGTQPSGIVIGAFDSDLNLDLAVASYGEAKVSVLLNQAPTATASPASLAFPDQGLGTVSGEFPVIVTNSSGGDPLSVNGYSIDGANAGDFEVSTQNCTLIPVALNHGCQMDVIFIPSSLGTRNATLEITYDGADSPLTVPLASSGIDITPPDTVIDSGPSGMITTDSATFAFRGDPADDTAKIMCSLDSAAFVDCTSPMTFPGLADGAHAVAFRAEDAAGNQDPTPATRTFSVKKPVSPALKAKIGKVTVKGPGKLKTGKSGTYKVKITNSGNAAATGVNVRVSGKGVKTSRSVGSIYAGKSKTVKVKLRLKRTGKIKVSFKVVSSSAGSKTVRKTINVRR